MNEGHYKHADRDSLAPIGWESDEKRAEFKQFVVDYLSENGPTHVSQLITQFFETEYLSPVYMGRLSDVLVALGELSKCGQLLIESSEYLPVRLPHHQPMPASRN